MGIVKAPTNDVRDDDSGRRSFTYPDGLVLFSNAARNDGRKVELPPQILRWRIVGTCSTPSLSLFLGLRGHSIASANRMNKINTQKKKIENSIYL